MTHVMPFLSLVVFPTVAYCYTYLYLHFLFTLHGVIPMLPQSYVPEIGD